MVSVVWPAKKQGRGLARRQNEQVKPLALDPLAAAKLSEHLEGSKAECLRLRVQGGGCSGFEYRLELDSPNEKDEIFESEGQRIICDPVSLSFVEGSIIHYEDGLQGAGFVVENPNITGSCGCGMSFYT